jgi:sporulation-control protein spo0M
VSEYQGALDMVIDELKAKAGFGGAKLKINVQKDQYSNNGTISGELVLSGGKVSQKIQALSIKLICEWSTEYYTTEMNIAQTPVAGIIRPVVTSIQSQYELEEDRGKEVVLDLMLAKDIEIDPDEKKNFIFEIDISKIQKKTRNNDKWKLQARADIPYAKDAVTYREIKIEKPGNTLASR